MVGPDALVGAMGVAQQALAPEGQIMVHGELWLAESPLPVAAGETVRVRAVSGLKLLVETVREHVSGLRIGQLRGRSGSTITAGRKVPLLMPGIPILVIVAIVVLYLLNCIKILREYERGVIFRLGRIQLPPKGPGLIFVFRPLDQIVRVSLRQEVMEVPPQDVITKDNVTIKVNAVITMRVMDPAKAVVEVSNYVYQTSQFAQTTLRSVLGEVELDGLLSHRDALNQRIQTIIDLRTEPWGVKVVSVEVKQVDLPESMLRAMAKQAEAEREKRSKIINAEGEFSAAQRLVEAADLLAAQPVTLQLKYLQTLIDIGVEKNTTIVFPLPMELLSMLGKRVYGKNNPPPEKK